MAKDNAEFSIHIRHVDREYNAASSEERMIFWSPLIEKELADWAPEARPARPSVDLIESLLLQSFGRCIKEALVSYFSLASRQDMRFPGGVLVAPEYPIAPKFADLLPLVGFEVRTIEYGSLDLSIEIAGVQYLAKLFTGNLDVFMMFLKGYLPEAFTEALRPLNLNAHGLSFDPQPSTGLLTAFATSTAPTGTPTEFPTVSKLTSEFSDKSRFFWLIANGSLVVPVVLSLAVLYVAIKDRSEERLELRTALKDVTAREAIILQHDSNRVKELEKTQMELMELSKLRAYAVTPTAKKSAGACPCESAGVLPLNENKSER